MGWNGPVVGQIPHFGPFSLQKISERGAKEVENQVPPNPVFSTPTNLESYKKHTYRVLGWKKGLVRVWWVRLKFLCQNLSWDSAQATGVVRLTPNFVDQLVMLIKYGLRQKIYISGHLLRRPPLWFWYPLNCHITHDMVSVSLCKTSMGHPQQPVVGAQTACIVLVHQCL